MIGLLSRASAKELLVLSSEPFSTFDVTDLKPAEAGLLMLRGRMGGDGAPFNLGEASMARATVEIEGRRGFGFRLGRDAGLARQAAIADALWQNPALSDLIEEKITDPVRQRLARAAAQTASQAAATRVDFFTLVRGDVS